MRRAAAGVLTLLGLTLMLDSAALAAEPTPGAAPEWNALWAFPAGLGVGLIISSLVFVSWDVPAGKRRELSTQLKQLPATWSFKDSWVSNLTVGAGLLTGIFGSSEVVTALLGEEADESVALAIVGAAFAVALVGAGAIIAHASKTPDPDAHTVGGLLAASAVTLAGALGEVFVVYRSGANLELGGWEDRLWIPALLAALLLLWYSVSTLGAILQQGTKEPPAEEPEQPSDTIIAATMIVKALKEDVDTEKLLRGVIEAYPTATVTAGTSPGDDYPAVERSAML